MICALWLGGLRASADEYPRQSAIDIQHYVFDLTLSDTTDEIRGKATVQVRLRDDEMKSFFLDLENVKKGETGGADDSARGMIVDGVLLVDKEGDSTGEVVYEHHDDHLVIHTGESTVKKGEIRIYEISYHGIPKDGLIIGKSLSGKRTFFSDHFPNRARDYLPTIDHPHDRATSEFIITAPAHYRVVSNGLEMGRVDLGDGMVRTHWKEDKPISTYLMVIGAADFTVRDEPAFTWRGRTVPISTWVYQGDEAAGLDDFAITVDALKYFSGEFGPFPFKKLANVESSTRWGGMENASCIFYPERSVAGNRSMDNTVVHEIVHQWFGDGVTVSDWNHVWLSEGFATYFTHVFNEETYGRDRAVEGLKRDRARVIQYERTHPGVSVVDENLGPNEILSALSYQKGGWVLHMLRRKIGGGAFSHAISQYYRKNRYGNVVTDDFRKAVKQAYGRPIEWFFDQWIYKPGHPIVEGSWSFDESSRTIQLKLQQVQTEQPVFRIDIDVAVIGQDGHESNHVTLRMTEITQSFQIDVVANPARVVLDPDTWLLFENRFEETHE